jgi:hypothetical protein
MNNVVEMHKYATPLRSRLLAIPELRAQYLDQVRTIAKVSQHREGLAPDWLQTSLACGSDPSPRILS